MVEAGNVYQEVHGESRAKLRTVGCSVVDHADGGGDALSLHWNGMGPWTAFKVDAAVELFESRHIMGR